jgi:SAM-dependent methyltransferase
MSAERDHREHIAYPLSSEYGGSMERSIQIEQRLSEAYLYGGRYLLSVNPNPQKIYEVGTFYFQQGPYLASLATESVTSLDIDPGHLYIASQRPDVKALGNKVKLKLGDALTDITPQEEPDNSYDAAFIIEVLGAGFDIPQQWQGDPLKALFENMHRILKPNGVLTFTIKVLLPMDYCKD